MTGRKSIGLIMLREHRLDAPSGLAFSLKPQLDFGPLCRIAGEIDQAIDRVVGDFSVILCVTRCFEIAWCP